MGAERRRLGVVGVQDPGRPEGAAEVAGGLTVAGGLEDSEPGVQGEAGVWAVSEGEGVDSVVSL